MKSWFSAVIGLLLLTGCQQKAPKSDMDNAAAMAAAQVRQPPGADGKQICDITIFVDSNFTGASTEFFTHTPTVPAFIHDQTSSVIVTAGQWRLYQDTDYYNTMGDYGPGRYQNVYVNDQLDSLWCISQAPPPR